MTILYLFTKPYHWLLSLILSVHFRNWMHLNINIVDIYIWLLATTQKLRKSPVFQFLVLAVNHFVLTAILNTCNIFHQIFTMVEQPIPPRRYIYLKLGTFLTEHENILNFYFIKNNQKFKIHHYYYYFLYFLLLPYIIFILVNFGEDENSIKFSTARRKIVHFKCQLLY